MNDPKTLEPGHTHDPASLWSPKQTTNMAGFEARSYDNNHFSSVKIYADGRQDTQVSGVLKTDTSAWTNSQAAPWSSARDQRTGFPLAAHEVTGDSILSFPNFGEVTRDQAVALGLISNPNQGGTPNQTLAPQKVATGEQPVEELHPDLQEEPITREVEAALAEVYQSTSAMTHAQAFQELATGGDVSQATLAAAASQMGTEPSQVQAAIDNLRPHFVKQADEVASRLGVDPASVWQWGWKNQPGKMQEAINRHLTLRNTHGYQKIANEYVQKLDTIAPEMILGAEFGNGITAAKARDGVIVLTLPGGAQVGWSEAISAGLVSLSRG
ncbi:MAG TPA: hypothetical protein VM639_22945 [Dongiaceae bacterium]|nr:hypothetical protein [Dongiaceae bacterium]